MSYPLPCSTNLPDAATAVVVGVVGGVASGKSLVCGQLARLGAVVLDVDRVGHQVLQQPEVREALGRRWGPAVVGPQGEIDRSAVAKIVFGPPPQGPRELNYLEQVTHPRIAEHVRHRLDELRQQQGVRAIVLDAALLLEAGWDSFCDQVLFVETPPEVRQARAEQRGWTADEFAAREAAQQLLDQKRKQADWVIDNSGPPDNTWQQVQQFWRTLTGTCCSAGLQ